MLFEAHDVTKSYGVVRALSNVSVQLGRGEVHAVIGENGAGKSTLMNVVCGKVRPDSGRLLVDGKPCSFASPREAQIAGIGIAPQEINLVPELSVAENIVLGAQSVNALGIVDWKQTRARAIGHLQEIDDSIDLNAPAGRLSKADQQLVQIARAAATRAQILIFDEPTAALTSRETDKLFGFIRRFSAAGNAIFYISHRLEEVLELSHRITVLRDGAFISELDPKKTSKDEMVRQMAGRAVKPAARRSLPEQSNDVVLAVRGLSRDHEFSDISFDLHRGEVLGIAGLIGSGRTELGKCLFGVTRPDAGTVGIFGEPVTISHPADAIGRGLVYLPEERKQEGIFALLSIRENMGVAVLDRFRGLLGLNMAQMAAAAQEFVESLKIKIGSLDDPITSLSGGNQQKVIIGRWLMKEARILILDEPTRGIDVNAKGEIQTVLHKLAREGLSIIYISSELQEVIDMSDRILVMHEGVGKGIVPAAGASQESLLAIAMS